jgi:hypothetical protein
MMLWLGDKACVLPSEVIALEEWNVGLHEPIPLTKVNIRGGRTVSVPMTAQEVAKLLWPKVDASTGLPTAGQE